MLNYIKSPLFYLPIIQTKHNHAEECKNYLNNDDNNCRNYEIIPNNHILKKIIESNILKIFIS